MKASLSTRALGPRIRVACVVSLFLLLCPVEIALATTAMAGRPKDPWQYSGSPWGAGVVVPNGARVEGGKLVSWTTARNLTALVQLPNITRPNAVTYVVLSAMGNDRKIIQVAAGVWPQSDSWSTFSWFVTGVDSAFPSYEWVLNSSAPRMRSGDFVSMSVVLTSSSGWELGVDDENTSSSLVRTVQTATTASFASGDQEVFALESYSRSDTTFREMGNMTVVSLLVDGKRVTDGWYSYGGWDAIHSPLFVVGSSSAPYFMSLDAKASGRAVWSYDPLWIGAGGGSGLQPVAIGYIALGCAVPIAFLLSGLLRRPHDGRSPSNGHSWSTEAPKQCARV